MALNAKDVAAYLLKGLEDALLDRGKACLVVSGGSSPVPIFTELAKTPFAWDKVTITLVDERAVPPTHEDSNHLLVTTHLLQGYAKDASFIPLYDNDAAHAQIADAGGADVILLGMGGDGHFASLFPDMIGQEEAFDQQASPMILTTGPQGMPVHPRISMNLAMICLAKHICLILPNDEKKAVFEAASRDKGLPMHYLQSALGPRLVLFS